MPQRFVQESSQQFIDNSSKLEKFKMSIDNRVDKLGYIHRILFKETKPVLHVERYYTIPSSKIKQAS